MSGVKVVVVDDYTDHRNGDCRDGRQESDVVGTVRPSIKSSCNLRAAFEACHRVDEGRVASSCIIETPSLIPHRFDQGLGQMITDLRADDDGGECRTTPIQITLVNADGGGVVIDGFGNVGRFASVGPCVHLEIGDGFTFENFLQRSFTTVSDVGEAQLHPPTMIALAQNDSSDLAIQLPILLLAVVAWWWVVSVAIPRAWSTVAKRGFGSGSGRDATRGGPRTVRTAAVHAAALLFVAAAVPLLCSFVPSPQLVVANDEPGNDDGGFMSVWSGEIYSVEDDTTLSGFDVADYGGVFFIVGGTVRVGVGAVFKSNSALAGGAVYVDRGGVFEAGDSCKFTGNAGSYAGAIYAFDSQVTIGDDCTFSGNSAYSYGGGIYAIFSPIVIGDGCRFSVNSVSSEYSEGGGIYADHSTVTIGDRFAFSGSSAYALGGGIYAIFSSIVIGDSCMFSGSVSYNYGGGAIHASSSPVAIGDGCTFVGNSARQGGAISADHSPVIIGDGCTFSGNEANGEGGEGGGPLGGAIYASSASAVTIGSSCSFVRNRANLFGGAIFATSGAVIDMEPHAAFVNNVAWDGADGFVDSRGTLLLAEPAEFSFIYQGAGGVVIKGCPAGTHGKQNYEDTGSAGGDISNVTTTWPASDDCSSSSEFVSCCSDCAEGTFAIGSQLSCSDCGAGYYQDDWGEAECKPCGAGTYQDDTGQTSCNECKPGTYKAAGSSSCHACPAGYVPSANRTACELCGEGNYSLAGLSECIVCPRGKYSVPQRDKCDDCEAYISATTSAKGSTSPDDCLCYRHHYLDDAAEASPSCKKCVDGMVCEVEGTELSTVELASGFWRTSVTSSAILQCPIKSACAGGVNISTYCRFGYAAGSAFCDVCDAAAGFAKSSAESESGNCIKCGEGLFPRVFGPIVFGVLGIALVAAVVTEGRICMALVPARLRHCRCLDVGKRVLSAAKEHRAKLKQSFVTYQIICGMSVNFDVTCRSNAFTVFSNGGSIVNLDLLPYFSFGCMNQSFDTYSARLLFATLAPATALAVLYAIYRYRLHRATGSTTIIDSEKGVGRAALRAKFVDFALLIIYLIYPSTSSTVLNTFLCEDFDDGTRMLKYDYAISCYSSGYRAYRGYATVMVFVYPLGVPCLFAWLLYNSRLPGCLSTEDSIHRFRAGKVDAASTTTGLLRQTEFLWRDYSADRWWFEVLECLRRLLLTGALLTPLNDEPESKLFAAHLFAIVFMAIYLEMKPYRSASDNTVGIIAQAQIALTFMAACIVKSGTFATDGYSDSALGGALVVINATIIIVAGAHIAKSVCWRRNCALLDNHRRRRTGSQGATMADLWAEVAGGGGRETSSMTDTLIPARRDDVERENGSCPHG